MASAAVTEELNCTICLEIFTDPVTLRCGHNFCRVCINKSLDTQRASGVYSCPECRMEFTKRPALQRNRTLRNIAEHFSSKPQKEDVNCMYCIELSVPAVKSCLMCEASLCIKHLEVHSKSPEHVLCEPISSFKKLRCPIHNQVFMYYCTEDAKYLCVSCTLSGQHMGHQMELLNDFCTKKKEKLMNVHKELSVKKTDLQKNIRDLELPKERLESKFIAIENKVTSIFKDILEQLEMLKTKTLQEIKARRKKMMNDFMEQISELDRKKQELCRKMDHIEELCSMTDPIAILQELNLGSNQALKIESMDKDNLQEPSEPMEEDMDESGILMTIHKDLSDIFSSFKQNLFPEKEAKITLDITTAANNVFISDDRKTASWLVNQGRPMTSERFQYHQVLSVETFSSDSHYWEVETSETGNWMVGVAYPSIEREGNQAIIGKNNKSWSLCKWNNQYFTLHDKKQNHLNVKFGCRKFRMSLEYNNGRLTFYELNNLTKPAYTFFIKFTEPLHAAISVWDSAWVTVLSQE
ncbi:PREDICTED: E3 ubiquitin/ISG15 ligase TRIM25-like [Nanorana parkeri]|uniref:E3 ubiquitin/ISG15 ligase TRIM25-like n=1 Tax=Nanorana parkeri TaxID=125878 RepID=UPI0008542EC0|nr:PREDICTED: E3 ubiquitin/ISG15 ligase TRIM25-like [Nanorana parkeri]